MSDTSSMPNRTNRKFFGLASLAAFFGLGHITNVVEVPTPAINSPRDPRRRRRQYASSSYATTLSGKNPWKGKNRNQRQRLAQGFQSM